MRSYLFVPADSERKLEKAPTSGADCLLIDLEDSVSYKRKELARTMAADFLRNADRGRAAPRLIVRVNSLDSDLTADDLEAVVGAAPHGILLPKSGGGADVQHLATMLSAREAEADIEEGSIRIHALISETAAGVLSLEGQMIDRPHLTQAERVLTRARAAGLIE